MSRGLSKLHLWICWAALRLFVAGELVELGSLVELCTLGCGYGDLNIRWLGNTGGRTDR
jgi:hypothetical protein